MGDNARQTLGRVSIAIGLVLALTLLLADLAPAATSATAHASTGTQKAPSTARAEEAVRIGLGIALGTEAILALILLAIKVPVLRVFVGKDGRLSTSKTIAAVWTIVVAACLLALVYADLIGHPGPLNVTNAAGVAGQYALLFGGPLGAAILAKAIVVGQVSADSSIKPSAESASPGDLVTDDAGETDLGDLQYVLFNLVALVFVLGTFLNEPLKGLPHIPDVLLGLTSVAAVGYVGKKLLPPESIKAELGRTKAKKATSIPISVVGLPVKESAKAEFWVRFGESDEGHLYNAEIKARNVTFDAIAPTLDPEPTQAVNVTVVTEFGTLIKAGSFTYEP
jgi:hypothetical protein